MCRLIQQAKADIRTCIPFAIYLCMPFATLGIPLILTYLPSLLPSAFVTANQRRDMMLTLEARRRTSANELLQVVGMAPCTSLDVSCPSAFLRRDKLVWTLLSIFVH